MFPGTDRRQQHYARQGEHRVSFVQSLQVKSMLQLVDEWIFTLTEDINADIELPQSDQDLIDTCGRIPNLGISCSTSAPIFRRIQRIVDGRVVLRNFPN